MIIDPARQLTNYKLLDDIMMEIARKLKIQQLHGIHTTNVVQLTDRIEQRARLAAA